MKYACIVIMVIIRASKLMTYICFFGISLRYSFFACEMRYIFVLLNLNLKLYLAFFAKFPVFTHLLHIIEHFFLFLEISLEKLNYSLTLI